MKTIKYIILGIFILTSTLGRITTLMGQGSIDFSETYSFQEVVSGLEPTDPFFRYINTEQTDSKSSKMGYCLISEKSTVQEYLDSGQFLSRLPENLSFAWGAVSENTRMIDLYALRKPSGKSSSPDNSDIAGVSIQSDEHRDRYDLLITFTQRGADRWATLTGTNVDRDIAIVINGRVYATPRVKMKIKQGKCLISGNFSMEELIDLKSQLENPSR
jgi:SecD/SecF fusion protein